MFLALTLDAAAADGSSVWRAALSDPAGWEEVSRKEVRDVGEIVIRHKEVQGQNCLEGTAYAPLSPDALLAAAADVVAQPRWSSWEVPASVKLSSGTDRFDYYQVLDNPSPVSDRYWFLRGVASRSGGERAFTWDFVDPAAYYPEALADVRARFPGAVMTQVNVGDWTFTPQGTTTRVRYRICTDAGGAIPRWVGEIAATRTLPTNIADIITEVRRKIGG